MTDDPYTPGTVDWTGENPGMYLKADPAGDWISLLCFFRITWSPHGPGHALVALEDPSGADAVGNQWLTGNAPMARDQGGGGMSRRSGGGPCWPGCHTGPSPPCRGPGTAGAATRSG